MKPVRSLLGAPRRLTLAAVVLSGLVAPACKRREQLRAPEFFDDLPASEQAVALATLTPPWQSPKQERLRNGAVAFWLEESGTPAFHLRWLIPTEDEGKPSQAGGAATTIVVEHLQTALQHALRRTHAVVELDHRPGRVELVVHGRDGDAELILAGLSKALVAPPAAALVTTQRKLGRQLEQPWSETLATAALVSQIVGTAPGSETLSTSALESVRPEALDAAWKHLTDPRRAVLIVHAGRSARALDASLLDLAERWEAPSLLGRKRSAIERLRANRPSPTVGSGALASDTPPPFWHDSTPARGGPVLVLGRALSTASVRERSFARLAQRLAQEELDVRLAIAGDRAMLVVVAPLEGDPQQRVRELLEQLDALSQRRHETQRIFQAAQLWLGARVVGASLEGEDWTALWSEAIDLADRDEDIATALTRDAKTMLAIDPEALLGWQGAWFAPSSPGWSWALAGIDPTARAEVLEQLGKIAPVRPWPQ